MSDPSHFHANLQRGSALLNAGRARDALPFLQAAIAANPDAPQGYAELARCWSESKRNPHKSIDAIDRAIALAPNVSFYHGCKAWYLVRLKRPQPAVIAAKDGLAINPNCVQSLNGLANAYTLLRQWRRTEEICRRVLALNPNDVTALNLLAQSLRLQGRHKESREVVAHLLALVPNDAFGQANAGYAALAVGDHLRADEHFLNSLRMNPHSDHARRGLLSSLRARNWLTRPTAWILTFHRDTRAKGGHSAWTVLALIVGIPLCFLLVGMISKTSPLLGGAVGMGLLLSPLIYFILAIVLGYLADFLLLFDPLGRHAMTPQEKKKAWIPGLILMLGLAGLLALRLWTAAWICLLVFTVLALSIQIPLLKDRWLRRRLARLS